MIEVLNKQKANTFYILLLGLLINSNAYCQSDSVQCVPFIQMHNDAKILALREIVSTNSIYIDSTLIPSSYYLPILNDLGAIHQSSVFGVIDTIFNRYNIHIELQYDMQELPFRMDTSANWAKNWFNGNLLCGNGTIDSIVSKYNLTLIKPTAPYWPEDYTYTSSFIFPDVYNYKGLKKEFAVISGFHFDIQRGLVYGNEIVRKDFGTYREYTFEKCFGGGGWDVCYALIDWTFRVDNNCVVTYVGRKQVGTIYSGISDMNEINQIFLSPNPAQHTLHISGLNGTEILNVYDLTGRSLNIPLSNSDIDVSSLSNGTYLLQITNEKGSIVKKFTKE